MHHCSTMTPIESNRIEHRWASAVRGVLHMGGWTQCPQCSHGVEDFFKGEGTFLARARLCQTVTPLAGSVFGLQISDTNETWEAVFSQGTPTEAIKPVLQLAASNASA